MLSYNKADNKAFCRRVLEKPYVYSKFTNRVYRKAKPENEGTDNEQIVVLLTCTIAVQRLNGVSIGLTLFILKIV
jgi:hypothetical protein